MRGWLKPILQGTAGFGWLVTLVSILFVFTDYDFTDSRSDRKAQVVMVPDVNTIILKNWERVHLKTCDLTILTEDQNKDALHRMRDFIQGKYVDLTDEEWRKDNQGRTLADIKVDGQDLCTLLIREGLGRKLR